MSDTTKDIPNIKLIQPNNLICIKEDIDNVRNKTEKIIKNYIERIIYTSTLPDEIKLQINKVFEEVKSKT
jgi:hypothetical protein